VRVLVGILGDGLRECRRACAASVANCPADGLSMTAAATAMTMTATTKSTHLPRRRVARDVPPNADMRRAAAASAAANGIIYVHIIYVRVCIYVYVAYIPR